MTIQASKKNVGETGDVTSDGGKVVCSAEPWRAPRATQGSEQSGLCGQLIFEHINCKLRRRSNKRWKDREQSFNSMYQTPSGIGIQR